MTRAFNMADNNQDGRLSREEYGFFYAGMIDSAASNGEWIEEGDHVDEDYAIINSVSAEDGFTMAEMQQVMGPWLAKMGELQEADQ